MINDSKWPVSKWFKKNQSWWAEGRKIMSRQKWAGILGPTLGLE